MECYLPLTNKCAAVTGRVLLSDFTIAHYRMRMVVPYWTRIKKKDHTALQDTLKPKPAQDS